MSDTTATTLKVLASGDVDGRFGAFLKRLETVEKKRGHGHGGGGGGERAPGEKGISALGLVAVGFFWVSGGSYGNEALVLAAPPGTLSKVPKACGPPDGG